MQVKDLIRSKRIEKGLTTTELGKLVGVSHTTISRWESGNIATMKQTRIALLANALGISPIELLKDESLVVESIDFKRTTDLGLRLTYFLEELHIRETSFTLDGIELTEKDLQTIETILQSSIQMARSIIKSKH